MSSDSYDPLYECDAPRYVDFEQLQRGELNDTDADHWFDHQVEQDSAFEDDFVTSNTAEDKPSVVVKKEREEEKKKEVCTNPLDAPVSLFGWNFEKKPKVKRENMESQESLPKSKRACPLRALPVRVAAQVAASKNRSLLTPKSKAVSSLTMPRTPDVLKHAGVPKQQGKTWEELQMGEIARMQRETKHKLRISRKSFRNLAKSSKPVPVKYSKPVTEAVEFKFRTKGRDRGKSPSLGCSSAAINPTNFPSILRSSSDHDYHPHIPSSRPPSATKVKPFKFELDSRLNAKKSNEDCRTGYQGIPNAEFTEKYHKATPLRFRTRKQGSAPTLPSSSSDLSHLTMPKTPKLLARTRSRPVTAKSAAQKEEEEATKMKEYKFKANPLNLDIFRRGGLYGVPRKQTEVPLTTPSTPKLATRERRDIRRAQEEIGRDDNEEEVKNFHAKPIPHDIFERVKGVPEKRPLPLTYPKSPGMRLKRRRLHEDANEDGDKKEEETFTVKATPMPNFDSVFQPDLPHKVTAPEPFTFEERDKDKPNRKTLVQQILEKENLEKKREFHAHPPPDFTSLALPPKCVLPPTEFKPFDLHTDIRGEDYSGKWIAKLNAEASEARRKAEFKAKDAKVLYQEPFIPQRTERPPTEVENIVLHTEVRREQRAKFEVEKQEKEAMREQESLQRKALREMAEAKTLAKYRKALVHRAQPFRLGPAFVVKPSTLPLTAPQSPLFRTDGRLRRSTLKTDV